MFDKENFSNILKKINNEYASMTEFAQKASLDRSYISKYINKKLDNPPTPKRLLGIANASKELTTYEELMQMCGYINLSGLYDIPLNKNEKQLLTKMLLAYQEHLQKDSYSYFDEKNFLTNLNDDIKSKLIIAFRRNSLDLILNTHDKNFEFIAEDDAMYPLLDTGDIALIYKQNEIDEISHSNKGTYLIKLDGKNTIRKIVLNEDRNCYTLIAMNACYKTIDIEKDDFYNKIEILGKVIKAENKSAFK